MRQVAESPRWAARLAGVLRGTDSTDGPEDYARLAISSGLVPDAWETTYVHLLGGDDPVLRWVHGTGLRPVISALTADEFAEFESEYGALLRQAYPSSGDVTPFSSAGSSVWHRSRMGLDRLSRCQIPMPKSVH